MGGASDSLLRTSLPPSITRLGPWPSLRLVEGSFTLLAARHPVQRSLISVASYMHIFERILCGVAALTPKNNTADETIWASGGRSSCRAVTSVRDARDVRLRSLPLAALGPSYMSPACCSISTLFLPSTISLYRSLSSPCAPSLNTFGSVGRCTRSTHTSLAPCNLAPLARSPDKENAIDLLQLFPLTPFHLTPCFLTTSSNERWQTTPPPGRCTRRVSHPYSPLRPARLARLYTPSRRCAGSRRATRARSPRFSSRTVV